MRAAALLSSQTDTAPRTPAAIAPVAAPVRPAFLYVPNGIDMKNWNVARDGAFGELPRVLRPLAGFRDDMILAGARGAAVADGSGWNPAYRSNVVRLEDTAEGAIPTSREDEKEKL